MAVTLQLARSSRDLFEKCRTDKALCCRLLSYELLPKEQYADMGWMPTMVDAISPALRLSDEEIVVLKHALAGQEILVIEEDFDIYSDVRICEADNVESLSEKLNQIDFCGAVDRGLSEKWSVLVSETLWGSTESSAGYWKERFKALRVFFEQAAKNRQAIVFWWD